MEPSRVIHFRWKMVPFEPVGFTGHSLAQPWRDDPIPGRRLRESWWWNNKTEEPSPKKRGVECVFVCFCAPFFWGGVVFGGYSRVDVTYQLLIALMFSSAVFARYFSRISLHWMSMCQSASRYCSESCRIICMQHQDSLGGGLICLNMFHPYLGKYSNLTNIFQMGWNHQPVHHFCIFLILFTYVGLYMLSFFESFDYHFFPCTT